MIELPPERSAGMVPDAGDPIVHWLNGLVREPAQSHKLYKVARSGADERHLFVSFLR